MNFESNGSLAAGFHDCTYDEFYEMFVSGFPTSQRRLLIAEKLLDFSEEIFRTGVPYEFWVDGSYATTKINPNDADIVLFVGYQHMIFLGPYLDMFRLKYDGILDIYFAYAVCQENKQRLKSSDYQQVINHRNYWRGQFGFDRLDNPKGIIRIDCKSIRERLNRR